MRDLRNRIRAAVVLCSAGPVASFLPPVLPAGAGTGPSVAAACTEGVSTRRSTFRAPVCSTRLGAATDQPEGHALREPQESNSSGTNTSTTSTSTSTIDSGASAESSTAHEPQPNVATLDTPVAGADAAAAAAADADAAAAAGSAEGRSSQVGGEGGAEQAPTMAAVGQEVDTRTVGGGHSKEEQEEEEGMAELLAQQPGGQGEVEGDEGDDGAPQPMKRVRKRLKKYYPKDFQDSTWTVAVQWNHAKYEVQTTKIALKADGSVVWLDKGKGSWIMRTKSRDISIYRNFFLNWGGMRIYSAKLLDNTCDIYLSGIIKGWQPFLPLSRMGTWQAVRRGIKIDENTPRPPWEQREVVEEVTFGDGRKRKNKPIELEVDLD